MKKNLVIFKGIPNGLLIILDNEAPFEEIKTNLLEKVKQNKKFFDGANISITFKGRELKEDEEISLLKIISKQSGIDISFVNLSSDEELEQKKQDNYKAIEPTDFIKFQDYILSANNSISQFYKGSLRSGQQINFSGSIIIIGDVNPGAKVIASGNIIVLGKLKGVAHAGSNGDKNCFVVALKLEPSQIIIGDCLASFPTNLERELLPEYAYVLDNKIIVESLIK